MKKHNRSTPATTLVLLLALHNQAWALQSDRDQPVHIEADNVELDDQRGISTYRGNVIITQGTLRITGDKVTIYTNDAGELQRAVSVGQPATYKQRPDNKPEDVQARALTMEYFADRDTVVLTEEAHLWQGPNTFTSKKITYDVANDRVDAGKETGGDRVRITIQPERKDGSAGSDAQ